MPSSEILAVLADEVKEAGEAIGASLAHLTVAEDDKAFQEAAAEYLEPVQRIAQACEALGLDGIKTVCNFVESNIGDLSRGDLAPARQNLLERWPQLLLGYIKAPKDGVYSRELAEMFTWSDWPKPLDAAAATVLEQALLALDSTEEAEAEKRPARQTEARPEDVILHIAEDVNPKLVDAFLTEGPAQANEYSTLMQRIVSGDGWTEELQECRRLIHALKGAANTVGVRGVATLCHHVEDILEYLVENAQHPQGALSKLLIKVADTLEIMFEALLGTGEAPGDAQAVLQTVLDFINRIDRGEVEVSATPEDGGGVDIAGSALNSEPAPEAAPSDRETGGSGGTAQKSASPPVGAGAAVKVEAKVRVAARVIDDLMRASGEITISSGHVMERLQQALKVLSDLRERHGALWQHSSDMESFVTTQGIAAGRRQALASTNAGAVAGFDPLEMDQYSELHTYVHGLTETVADLQLLGTRLFDALGEVETAVIQQKSFTTELNDSLMTARMVPASNLESRLQRTVRQAAEQCGKLAELHFRGADAMLDDQMVNMLIDPLQHLLRNAVDHGLEAPHERVGLGKPEAGQLELGFARDGNYIVITCSDDGAGLDLRRIRRRAVETGLIHEDDELSEEETARLILRAGFSTAVKVTEVSGRGVGMDIVHNNIAKLKGSINIRTQDGFGSTFILRVPMSLGIVHCLLVTAAHQNFALPSDNLANIVYGGAEHVKRVDQGFIFDDGETQCAAYHLARMVGGSPVRSAGDAEGLSHVVLMNDVTGKAAIVIESVTSGHDLVSKSMGRYLANVRGVIGASIMGDGSVVPILGLAELLRIQRGQSVVSPDSVRAEAGASEADVLVVDDSLSVRTALATLLSEMGFRVRTAKDGVEAIEAIQERIPAAVLADLEMPRMNGLELTAHIRANASTRNLPVVMVTSRTAEKHRSQARAAGVSDYITKPYRESDLVQRLRTLMNKAA